MTDPTVKESVIEDYLYKKCKENGIICVKQTGLNAFPDRLLIGYDKMVFVETKRPGEDARDDQKAMIEKVRRRGHTALVIDSKEQIDELISEFIASEKKFKRKKKKS